jgi:hypothetical protein
MSLRTYYCKKPLGSIYTEKRKSDGKARRSPQIAIRLEMASMQKIRAMATQQKRSAAFVIRHAIDDFLARI